MLLRAYFVAFVSCREGTKMESPLPIDSEDTVDGCCLNRSFDHDGTVSENHGQILRVVCCRTRYLHCFPWSSRWFCNGDGSRMIDFQWLEMIILLLRVGASLHASVRGSTRILPPWFVPLERSFRRFVKSSGAMKFVLYGHEACLLGVPIRMSVWSNLVLLFETPTSSLLVTLGTIL